MEKLLIEKCKNGDGEAFEKLISTYTQRLFGYIYRSTKNRDDANDLYQEVVIKIWNGIPKYQNKNKFDSWIFTIAYNVVRDSLRKRKNSATIFTGDDRVAQQSNSNNNPDQIIESKELELKIEECLAELPENQRNVFLLNRHSGLPFREIAEIMNEPLNTVLSHMHYAVKKLKKSLKGIYNDE